MSDMPPAVVVFFFSQYIDVMDAAWSSALRLLTKCQKNHSAIKGSTPRATARTKIALFCWGGGGGGREKNWVF